MSQVCIRSSSVSYIYVVPSSLDIVAVVDVKRGLLGVSMCETEKC